MPEQTKSTSILPLTLNALVNEYHIRSKYMQVHHTLAVGPHMQQKLEATHTDEIKKNFLFIF